jgi:hypothetical protein
VVAGDAVATGTVRVSGSTRPLIVDKSQTLVDAGEPRYVVATDANGDRQRGASRNQQRPYVDLISIPNGRENCRNYLTSRRRGATPIGRVGLFNLLTRL